MILADSSVWIANLRGEQSAEVGLLRRSFNEIVVGDLILLEILQGARDDLHAAKLREVFSAFDVVTLCNPEIAVKTAANYRLLRSKGLTIRRTIDMIIATFCLEHDLSLLHRDRDYNAFEQHLGLRIAR